LGERIVIAGLPAAFSATIGFSAAVGR